ncbi:hypothetical protein HYW32_02720, partial [Candidatus Berkelbacteria bacterium]|nr:hypothetical protein [Candidatus Berkelbacteria bacterium]
MRDGRSPAPEQPVPPQAEGLVRNLKRRQGLLGKLAESGAVKGGESPAIPEIVIKDTLLRFLDKTYKGMTEVDVKDVNNRIFMLLNRAATLVGKKQDTSPVTAMYAHPRAEARPINEKPYGEYKNEIQAIIALCNEYGVSLKSVTGMQHGLGVPKTAMLDELLAWCRANAIDLKSVTGMQHGLGVPKTAMLDELLAWCRANAIDLKSVTGM